MATVPNEISYSAGSVLTAAQLNTNLRDAVNFLISRPVCQCRQTSAQSYTSGAVAALLFDTEDIDNDGMHSTSSNTSRLTAQTAGRYDLGGGTAYAANATGVRECYWAVNGSTVSGTSARTPAISGVAVALPARHVSVFLNVGDYLELQSNQNSGGALNTNITAAEQPSILARWVGTT